jgi:mono/diheme cytochrome c family protein
MMFKYFGLIAIGVALVPWSAAEAQERGPRPQVSAAEYDGWRQYSVQCARCHGQDVTGNPVAANLLVSARSGGPVAAKEAFTKVVAEGRAARGMPGFKDIMSAEQIAAVYTYVKGRADGRIPVGRPAAPSR